MKTACIYHSIDLDGWMSAAIVKHYFETIDKEQEKQTGQSQRQYHQRDFIGYNYGQPIPDLSEYDKVVMCDISFKLTIGTPINRIAPMFDLKNRLGSNFIWIDHHISAIDDVVDYCDEYDHDQSFTPGLRDTKFAACELTWKYFFPNNPMPEIVRLLGRYDCFGHKGTDEEQKVLEFQYGARQRISNYEEAYKYLIQSFDPTNPDIENIQYRGSQIYQYLCTEAKQIYANGFPLVLQQKVYETDNKIGIKLRKFICINKERFNPINFGIDYHADGYDGAACFHYDGKRKLWSFSLYNDNGKVDCSIIAKQFGGGGHKGAAGFVI